MRNKQGNHSELPSIRALRRCGEDIVLSVSDRWTFTQTQDYPAWPMIGYRTGATALGETSSPTSFGRRLQRMTAWFARHGSELAAAGGSAALATAIGAWVIQLWRASLGVPFVLGNDATANLMVVKDVMTHGWYLTNPSLAAPFGQELYDFAAYNGDNFYLLIIKLLGLPFGNPAVVMNLYFLLGFPLVAIASFAVLRRLGISIAVAATCSVLYAVLPSHFYRGEIHIFLGAYFMVPICCYLVLALMAGHELFGRRAERRGLRAYATWRTAGIVALCLVVGSSDTYFAAFTIALMAGATIVAFLTTRRARILICGLAASAIVLAAVGLNELPTVIYTAEHGKDTAVAQRLPAETETYGLSLANLVLPIEDHRIPALAKLTAKYKATAVAPAGEGESEWDNLGIVATLGLFGLALAACVRCLSLRGTRRKGEEGEDEDLRPVHAALVAGMAFLIGTIGGLATLFAYIVTPQLRAPNRISIFIGYFALFGVAVGLDRLRLRWRGRRQWRAGFAVVLVAVLVLGTLDQTSPKMAPDYSAEIAQYRRDGAFVREIEAEVPKNAEIYEIPYAPYPAIAAIGHASGYDEMIGYVHSEHLRWSAGAIVGRPADWEAAASTLPASRMLEEVSAVGFSGVWVDTFALGGESAKALPVLRGLLGVAPLVSSDGRLYFFDMSRYNGELRRRRSPAQIAQLAQTALHSEG
jgi:hypothetical protein